MHCTLAFKSYSRQFQPPLLTVHGVWTERRGILLRLATETGQVGFGEIAPLPWFGSETFEDAWAFCQQLPLQISARAIARIPANLPACQFGFETAWNRGFSVNDCGPPQRIQEPTYCRLLPTGVAALQTWPSLWQMGYRTFKWKIGVASLREELSWFEELLQALPPQGQVRLDANGGLTTAQAKVWLDACSGTAVEFLEQPLPPTALDTMLHLSRHASTPIALDESVATLAQLQTCHARGWRGIFVVKPAIAGYPSQLQQFCQTQNLDLVLSSVFETGIGQQAVLQLAGVLGVRRALGFGGQHWFDGNDGFDGDTDSEFAALWQQLTGT